MGSICKVESPFSTLSSGFGGTKPGRIDCSKVTKEPFAFWKGSMLSSPAAPTPAATIAVPFGNQKSTTNLNDNTCCLGYGEDSSHCEKSRSLVESKSQASGEKAPLLLYLAACFDSSDLQLKHYAVDPVVSMAVWSKCLQSPS